MGVGLLRINVLSQSDRMQTHAPLPASKVVRDRVIVRESLTVCPVATTTNSALRFRPSCKLTVMGSPVPPIG